jgi:hypothetical protein
MHIRVATDIVVGGAAVRLGARLLIFVGKDERAQLYVSHIPALDVCSQGRTEYEAVLALEQAIRSYLVVAHARGLLERMLRRRFPGLTDDAGIAASGQCISIARDRPVAILADTPAAAELSAF